MPKPKRLTAKKAKMILRKKRVHNRPLSIRQKKYFGLVAGGRQPRR